MTHDAAVTPRPDADNPASDTRDLAAARALLRERTGEIALLTRELIRTQDTLAAAQAEIVRLRGEVTALETERAEFAARAASVEQDVSATHDAPPETESPVDKSRKDRDLGRSDPSRKRNAPLRSIERRVRLWLRS